MKSTSTEERINFNYYGVDCDYDSDYYCTVSCDPYCRCRIIVDERVTDINISRMAKQLIEHLKIKDDEVNAYVIDRILRIRRSYDTNKWEIEKDNGYYGQEITGIYLKDESIINDIEKCCKLNTVTEKINHVLKLEYGYLLPKLEKIKWKLVEVDLKDIRYRQEEYKKKITVEPWYQDYDLPIAIVDDNMGLVDGYHRTLACHKPRVKVFKAVRSKEE